MQHSQKKGYCRWFHFRTREVDEIKKTILRGSSAVIFIHLCLGFFGNANSAVVRFEEEFKPESFEFIWDYKEPNLTRSIYQTSKGYPHDPVGRIRHRLLGDKISLVKRIHPLLRIFLAGAACVFLFWLIIYRWSVNSASSDNANKIGGFVNYPMRYTIFFICCVFCAFLLGP